MVVTREDEDAGVVVTSGAGDAGVGVTRGDEVVSRREAEVVLSLDAAKEKAEQESSRHHRSELINPIRAVILSDCSLVCRSTHVIRQTAKELHVVLHEAASSEQHGSLYFLSYPAIVTLLVCLILWVRDAKGRGLLPAFNVVML